MSLAKDLNTTAKIFIFGSLIALTVTGTGMVRDRVAQQPAHEGQEQENATVIAQKRAHLRVPKASSMIEAIKLLKTIDGKIEQAEKTVDEHQATLPKNDNPATDRFLPFDVKKMTQAQVQKNNRLIGVLNDLIIKRDRQRTQLKSEAQANPKAITPEIQTYIDNLAQ
ncbi:hypothetical protein ACQ4M3_39730 [Leptolyngbya sp. AN03gr2]|uniref:hypothetical protein n=1 Tax=unclassified Leptolyngbya TaxID=2650499 RepID=UPI003D3110D5